ncbi:adenylate/guanylate cyclase domain-containing protein [Actinotalea soli]|nr:adenylate/guanylate cyclase domain-containing protein [Actinotalea soli]
MSDADHTQDARGAGLSSTISELEDRLLGGPRTLTLTAMAEQAGTSVEEARLFWHTLGLPTGEAEAVAYTEADAQALRRLHEVAGRYEVSPRTAVSLVRAIGHTTDRLVLWQVEALVEQLAERHGLDDVSARLALLDRLGDIVPVLEDQLIHAWRRQLAAIAGRFAAEFGSARVEGPGEDELPLARAVGFADVVSFTRRTAELGPHELAEFVQQFEARARDVVTAAGGRVVKTIGDAVLFVADDAVTGARVAVGLAHAFRGTESPVRVGMVWGRVLSRFGDVFGPSVNLAARLTDEAQPGTVLLDEATAVLLAAGPRYTRTVLEGREVPGLGVLRPVLLDEA